MVDVRKVHEFELQRQRDAELAAAAKIGPDEVAKRDAEIQRAIELGITPGAVVKFRAILEEGDADKRFDVLELRGERVLVRAHAWQGPLAPTSVFRISELEWTGKFFNE
jgi:hypothetical protein